MKARTSSGGTILFESSPEFTQTFGSSIGTDAVISLNDDILLLAILVQYEGLDGNNLIDKISSLLSGSGLLMRKGSKCVLSGAGNVELSCHVFRGEAIFLREFL